MCRSLLQNLTHLVIAVLLIVVAGACYALDAESRASDTTQGSWYLGGGFAQLGLDNNHPSLGGHSGSGLYLLIGADNGGSWHFEASTAVVNVSTDSTCADPVAPSCTTLYYPEDSAEYFDLLLMLRYDLNLSGTGQLQPWLGLGLGYHYYNWDTYYYQVEGLGPTFAEGIDLPIEDNWNLRLDASYSRYSGNDNYGDGSFEGTTRQIGAAIVYTFR